MVKRIPSYFLFFQTFLGISLFAQSFPPVKPVSDEDQIRLILIQLEQGIKSQNLLRSLHGFDEKVRSDGGVTNKAEIHNMFLNTFAESKKRWEDSLFAELTPSGENVTDTWDFELEIDTLRILNKNTAQVKAKIYFGASPPDSASEWTFGKKHRETIMFKKINGEWRVKNVKKLFRVLSKFGVE